jgi:hypothetical protein
MQEEERMMIANALEESLGSAGDDPDIVEAKKRLLESGVLSSDMFDFDENNDVSGSLMNECLEELDGVDLESASPSRGETASDDGADREGSRSSDSPYDAQMGIYSSSVYTEHEPTESTGLLFGASPTTALRPSIFTAVASFAEYDADEQHESARKDL